MILDWEAVQKLILNNYDTMKNIFDLTKCTLTDDVIVAQVDLSEPDADEYINDYERVGCKIRGKGDYRDISVPKNLEFTITPAKGDPENAYYIKIKDVIIGITAPFELEIEIPFL